jgi:hypothetical protein
MRSSLFWDATQRRLVVTDVSGQTIGPIYKDLPLKIGQLGCPSQSVTTRTNLRCITTRAEIHLYRGGSLMSHTSS